MAGVPSITVTVLDGQLALSGATTADNVFVMIGPSPFYPFGLPEGSQPLVVATTSAVIPTMGYGPLSEAVAHVVAGGVPVLAMPAKWTLPGTPSQPAASLSNSNQSPPLLNVQTATFQGSSSGSQIDNYQVVVNILQGYNPLLPGNTQTNGLPGTARFAYSLDGGVNFSGAIPIPLMTYGDSAWTISTNYTLGTIVQTVAGYIYQCTIAGRSASSGPGPAASSGTVTDGTVTWTVVGASFPYAGYSTVAPAIGALTSATESGTAGPFNIPAGNTFIVTFDGGSATTYTFSGTRGTNVGTAATFPVTIGATPPALSFTLNGVSVSVPFTAGSTSELVALDAINAAIAGAGASGYATDNSGQIEIISGLYGTSSVIVITSNSTATTLGLTASSTAGTSTINNGIGTTTLGSTLPFLATATATQIVNSINAVNLAHAQSTWTGVITATNGTTGVLTLTSSTTGASSSVIVSSSSTSTLGFGTTIVYGTSLAALPAGQISAAGVGTSPSAQLGGAVAESVTGISLVQFKITTGGAYSAAYAQLVVDGANVGSPVQINSSSGQWNNGIWTAPASVVAHGANAYGLQVVFQQTGTYALNDVYSFATGSAFECTSTLASTGIACGVVINFPTGIYNQGDSWSFTTRGPHISATDMDTQIQSLIGAAQQVPFSMIIGVCNPSRAASTGGIGVADLVTVMEADLETLATQYQYARGLIVGVDATSATTNALPSDYDTALGADVLTRTMSYGGQCTITSSLTAQSNLDNAGVPLARRLATTAVQIHPGKVALGALPLVTNASTGPSDLLAFANARIGSTRSFPTLRGIYLSNGLTLAENGSDFSQIQYGRVMDKACSLAYQGVLPYLSAELVDTATGTLTTVAAGLIAGTISDLFTNNLITPGNAVAATVTVDTTNNIASTGILNVSIGIRPFAYAETINVTLGFVITPQ